MDIKGKHANEALLYQVVTQQNPHIVGMMGIHIMDVLAGELKQEEFAELLHDAEKNALATFSNSGGQVQQEEQGQEGEGQPQSTGM